MKKLEQINTVELYSYLQILENLISGNTQLINAANEYIEKKNVTFEEVSHYMEDAQNVNSELYDVAEKIQKEIDSRMLPKLGLKVGIRKCQAVYDRFYKFIEDKQREEISQELKLLKNDKTTE